MPDPLKVFAEEKAKDRVEAIKEKTLQVQVEGHTPAFNPAADLLQLGKQPSLCKQMTSSSIDRL